MANEQQVEHWNSEAIGSWVRQADRYDRQLEPFGREVLAAAGPDEGERVLDVGCGSGWLTREVRRAVGPSGAVVGVDVSAPLLELARAQAADEGLDDIELVQADAQVHDLGDSVFDAVVSRFGVMFFDDPVAALANLRSATTPGGRLVFACWQPPQENEWTALAIRAVTPHVGEIALPSSAGPGPFAFGDPLHVGSLLAEAGWGDVAVEPYRTTLLVGGGGTLDDAIAYYGEVFGGRLLAADSPARREAAVAALRSALADHVTPQGVRLAAAVWMASALRP